MSASIWQPGSIVTPQAANNSTLLKQSFTASAGQTIFDLTIFNYTVGVNALWVTKNGLMLDTGVGFVETSTSRLTLTAGATAGDKIVAYGFVGITGTVSVNTPSAGSVTTASLASSLVVPLALGGTGATDAATARTNLGLGTASVLNTGTVGAAIPRLDAAALSFAGSIDGPTWATAASASTTAIAAAASNLVSITGTATINAFDLAAGQRRTIYCTGLFTLANSAALVVPGGADRTVAAGDVFDVVGMGAGNCIITDYQKLDGTSLGSVISTGALIGYTVFTSSGSYIKATNNPSFVVVEVVGGGGGNTGGGTSSFGAWCSASGGAATTTNNANGAGGSGSGGDINVLGSEGASIGFPVGVSSNIAIHLLPGIGAFGYRYGNGLSKSVVSNNLTAQAGSAGGGGGGARKKISAALLAASETVTVGAAGTGAVAGIVIVWEYK
jgi:hypothetical protein